MSTEASIKIVNFVTPGAAVPVLGCGHFDVKVKMYLFFLKTILCTMTFMYYRQTDCTLLYKQMLWGHTH